MKNHECEEQFAYYHVNKKCKQGESAADFLI